MVIWTLENCADFDLAAAAKKLTANDLMLISKNHRGRDHQEKCRYKMDQLDSGDDRSLEGSNVKAWRGSLITASDDH